MIEMKKIITVGCGIIVMYLLSACSTADTNGSSKEIDTKTQITISNNHTVYFSVPLSTTSEYSGSQTTDNDPSTSVDPNLAVGLNGSTASLADEGSKLLMEGIESIFEAKMQEAAVTPTTPAPTPVVPNPVTTDPVDPDPVTTDPVTGEYETKYHHTTTASSDGGKSLVMCPGQVMSFESCTCDGVSIPYHGYDTGREIYWNMAAEPVGDIVCLKGGVTYRYKAVDDVDYGDCP